MEQRQLNFAEKSVQVLTLEELEKSYHENLTTGDLWVVSITSR